MVCDTFKVRENWYPTKIYETTILCFIKIVKFILFLFFSPHSPETLNQLRQQLHVAHNMSSSSGGALSPGPHSMTGQSSPSVYFGLSRRGSLTSLAGKVKWIMGK